MKHLLVETHLLGSKVAFLYIASLVSIFFGIYVIISKNPILSVLFLIGLFSTIAVYLIMIGLHFIGLSYLLVYIGAVSILFLFILMLINVRISELVTDNKNSIVLAILAILFFNYCTSDSLPFGASTYDIKASYLISPLEYLNVTDTNTIKQISETYTSIAIMDTSNSIKVASVASKAWDTMLIESTHIASLGNILYTNLFILFIITSLILLLSMVGSIVMTVNKPLSVIKDFTGELKSSNSAKPSSFIKNQ